MSNLTMVLAVLLVTAMVVTGTIRVLGGTIEHVYEVILFSMTLVGFIILFMEAFKLDV